MKNLATIGLGVLLVSITSRADVVASCPNGMMPTSNQGPHIVIPDHLPKPVGEWFVAAFIVEPTGTISDIRVVDTNSESVANRKKIVEYLGSFSYQPVPEKCRYSLTILYRTGHAIVPLDDFQYLKRFSFLGIDRNSIEPDNLGFFSDSLADCWTKAKQQFPNDDDRAIGLAACMRRHPTDAFSLSLE